MEFWRRAISDPLIASGLAVDLAPFAAVLFSGWGAAAIVMYYWVENLLIGLATIPRILVSSVTSAGPAGLFLGVFVTCFFTVHYGMFCFGHGVFLMSFLPGMDTGNMPFPGPDGLLGMVGQVLATWPSMRFLLLLTAGYMAALFVLQYWKHRDYQANNPVKEMFAPYGRIVVLHIGIFAGAAGLMAVGDPMVGVLALILLRAAFGVFMNARAQLKAEQPDSLPLA